MTDRFSGHDFEGLIPRDAGGNLYVTPIKVMARAADIANAKLEARLGPIVYGKSEGTYLWHEDPLALAYKPTHYARLFDITKLGKECEHEPENMASRTICTKCGIHLKACKWEPA